MGDKIKMPEMSKASFSKNSENNPNYAEMGTWIWQTLLFLYGDGILQRVRKIFRMEMK